MKTVFKREKEVYVVVRFGHYTWKCAMKCAKEVEEQIKARKLLRIRVRDLEIEGECDKVVR